MFNMGLAEILIVLAVALIFVGPAKIPEIARTVGRGLGKLRRASDEVRDTIQSEIDTLDREEIQKKIAADKASAKGDSPGPYAAVDPYIQEAAPQPEAGAGGEERSNHRDTENTEIGGEEKGGKKEEAGAGAGTGAGADAVVAIDVVTKKETP